jgi:hypothetical protein
MNIADNLKHIKDQIPNHVTLVAVSKTKPVRSIIEAYNAGQIIFGENKIQEMVEKYKALPKDIKWHMIGHLQRNKVKYMASFVDLIHGVDSLKTLIEIDKQANKCDRIINCLLQAKLAEEDTKFGLSFLEIQNILNSDIQDKLKNIKIVGLMGMASLTDNTDQIKSEFISLHNCYQDLKAQYDNISILSIGMSGDFPLAIECGSTMIRIGSAIFGDR